MSKHISFPDIGQYRNVIRNVASKAQYVENDVNGDPVYDKCRPLPTLEYEGTVKLHGTNAAICYHYGADYFWYQSRENVVTPESDNAGFARTFTEKEEAIRYLMYGACLGYTNITVCVYGEWCGQGIQKGVSISQLPKMFVVFAIRVNGEWLSSEKVSKFKNDTIGIYNIYDYPTWKINIDFKEPLIAQAKLQELTVEVERRCPVGAAFGKDGIGEGIVWKCITPGWEDSKFWMKVKGEKHSISRVKTLAAVDVELVKTQSEFVVNAVTEARCLQSISKLTEVGKTIDRTIMGDFIRWIYNDIVKEESDVAKESGLDLTEMGGPISIAARNWFYNYEKQLVGV